MTPPTQRPILEVAKETKALAEKEPSTLPWNFIRQTKVFSYAPVDDANGFTIGHLVPGSAYYGIAAVNNAPLLADAVIEMASALADECWCGEKSDPQPVCDPCLLLTKLGLSTTEGGG